MALIDISRSISPKTAVWPGDQEVEWQWTARLQQEESNVNLGALRMSTHTGTHADAPHHVMEEGGNVDELPLSVFVGPVQVTSVEEDSSIRPDHVEDLTAKRVLFKTPASTLPDDEWPDSIIPLEPKTIRQLGAEGTVLIGTDAPSVDPLESSTLPAHHALIEEGIVNLEGLTLEGVEPGRYFLMAFPLKIRNADAAPVRAVLSRSAPEALR